MTYEIGDTIKFLGVDGVHLYEGVVSFAQNDGDLLVNCVDDEPMIHGTEILISPDQIFTDPNIDELSTI